MPWKVFDDFRLLQRTDHLQDLRRAPCNEINCLPNLYSLQSSEEWQDLSNAVVRKSAIELVSCLLSTYARINIATMSSVSLSALLGWNVSQRQLRLGREIHTGEVFNATYLNFAHSVYFKVRKDC